MSDQVPSMKADGFASPESRATIDELSAAIHSQPEFFQQSFELFDHDPEHTNALVEFIRQHPEGALTVLSRWKELMDSEMDHEIEYDEETEELIQTSEKFRALKLELERAPDDKKETVRHALRRKRISTFLGRVAAA